MGKNQSILWLVLLIAASAAVGAGGEGFAVEVDGFSQEPAFSDLDFLPAEQPAERIDDSLADDPSSAVQFPFGDGYSVGIPEGNSHPDVISNPGTSQPAVRENVREVELVDPLQKQSLRLAPPEVEFTTDQRLHPYLETSLSQLNVKREVFQEGEKEIHVYYIPWSGSDDPTRSLEEVAPGEDGVFQEIAGCTDRENILGELYELDFGINGNLGAMQGYPDGYRKERARISNDPILWDIVAPGMYTFELALKPVEPPPLEPLSDPAEAAAFLFGELPSPNTFIFGGAIEILCMGFFFWWRRRRKQKRKLIAEN